MDNAWLGVPCGHCGRKGAVMGRISIAGRWFYLCHADADGYKVNPDCYHLVGTGREPLGSRKALNGHLHDARTPL